MKLKALSFAASFLLFAAAASAIDFGGHVGYFDNNVKSGFVGADLMVPLGMVVIDPNIDYWKSHGAGYWLANGDVALRFPHQGSSFWVGAGPTYGYVTSYHNGTSGGYSIGDPSNVVGLQYNGGPAPAPNPNLPGSGNATISGPFNGRNSAWGWDVNGGVGFSGNLRPYVTARYSKVRNLKAGGVAVGLRFGH